jgi:Cof subfamily protein (haloacid dehalogenase superfamily)
MTLPLSNDIRLLVLDLDGTLVDKSDRIHEADLEAIRKVQQLGVAVAIATGRGIELSLPAYKLIGSSLPLICYGGALIKEPDTGLVHRHWSLQQPVAQQVLDHAERQGERLSVHFYVENSLYVSRLNDATVEYFEGSQIVPGVVPDLRPLLDQEITKVRVLGDDATAITPLFNEMKNASCRTQLKNYRSLTYLEMDHPDVNKRLAVSYLTEYIMGLRPENVMAVGDDWSDVEMLQYARIGVAMGNSAEEVKSRADWVTTSLEENGVARAIETWILGGKSVAASAHSYQNESATAATVAW